MLVRCQEALSSLTTDPGLYQLLLQFTSLITEGVRVNVAQRKIAILKHLLKMIQALLENVHSRWRSFFKNLFLPCSPVC